MKVIFGFAGIQIENITESILLSSTVIKFQGLLRLLDLCPDKIIRGAIPAPAVFETFKAWLQL